MTPYSPEIEAAMRAFFRTLRENDRRRYAALEVQRLGSGPQAKAYISAVLGISSKTIAKGIRELQRECERQQAQAQAQAASPSQIQARRPPQPSPRTRAPGGGRKLKTLVHPELEQVILDILRDHTAGKPNDEQVLWTHLATKEIVRLLRQRGYSITAPTVQRILKNLNYRRRRQSRTLRTGEHQDRDAQFEVINRQRQEYLDSPNPVISVDNKAQLPVGPVPRPDQTPCWSLGAQRVYDHNWKHLARPMTTPFGVYDLKRNQGFMFIGTSDETSELACDAIGLWWEKWGKEAYPQAESLLILCDSGGSLRADVPGCSYELNKVDLQNLANRLGMELRITHYPSYASKYNPIEHRLFPHVHRVCNGIIFKDAAMVASQMATATTKTGLKVAAEVMEKVYKKGRKATKKCVEAVRQLRDAVLPLWNYRVLPNTA